MRLCASEPMNTGPECFEETSKSQELADNSEREFRDETEQNKNSETNKTAQTPQDFMKESKN